MKAIEKKDVRNEVFNALSDILFRSGASVEDFRSAVEWFMDRFFEPNDEESEEEEEE